MCGCDEGCGFSHVTPLAGSLLVELALQPMRVSGGQAGSGYSRREQCASVGQRASGSISSRDWIRCPGHGPLPGFQRWAVWVWECTLAYQLSCMTAPMSSCELPWSSLPGGGKTGLSGVWCGSGPFDPLPVADCAREEKSCESWLGFWCCFPAGGSEKHHSENDSRCVESKCNGIRTCWFHAHSEIQHSHVPFSFFLTGLECLEF